MKRTESIVSEKIDPHKATECFDRWVGVYVPASGYENNVPMISNIKFGIYADQYTTISLEEKEDQYIGTVIIDRIDDDTYYVTGTGRGYGDVISRFEKDDKIYVHYRGVDFLKKD